MPEIAEVETVIFISSIILFLPNKVVTYPFLRAFFTVSSIYSFTLGYNSNEIIVDVDKTELEQVSKAIKEEMENAYKLEVPLKVEIDTGTNW